MENSLEERKNAMSWWNTLRNTDLRNGTRDKGYYTRKYFELRMYKYLTGREIQIIYESEHIKGI